MTRFLLCILSVLCFMCGESYAKAYWHYETAEKDRELARLKLESMQNSSPAAGEVRIMKMVINSGKLEQQTVHASRTLSKKDLNRVSFLLMQVRPNPHFVRRTGGYKRVGRRTTYSEPRLFLLIRGEWREFSIYDITATEEMSSRWLLEEKLLEELLSLVERNAPKRPNKS